MKKIIYLVLILSLFFNCGTKQKKVERIIEDGVEVVINHIEPYKIKGEPSTFNLEKEFSIDLARDDIAEKGLSDVLTFDVDSERNIYFAKSRLKEDCVFKFDRSGNFVISFGHKGQGPGEIQFIHDFEVDTKDNILIADHVNRKALIFSKDGNLIKETRFAQNAWSMFPLENGKYLVNWREFDPTADVIQGFSLFSFEFEEIKVLDTHTFPNPLKKGRRGAPINPVFLWKISNGYIYISNENRGYEILKYDFEGNLLRKIRKEYRPVEIPEEFKKERKKRLERGGMRVWFPKYWAPFYDFFPDDEGRLFVKTYEEGKNPGEYTYDIFNPEGIFIGRKSLNIYSGGEIFVFAKAKRNRLYCIEEKESGDREFVVYKIIWIQ